VTFEWLERYKDDPRISAFCGKVGLPVPGVAGGLGDVEARHHL
jgi:hypothetical protein